jgi:hypothetical protein
MARSRLIHGVQAASRNLHWLSLAGGLAATALCAAILLESPGGLTVMLEPQGQGRVFATGPLDRDGSTETLSGIAGETFAPGATVTASEDIVLSADGRDLAKVVLEDGAERRCLTVTTANGQIVSFRILGVRPSQDGQKADSDKVELAISACARNGQSAVKAVMEPEAGQHPKTATSGHSL